MSNENSCLKQIIAGTVATVLGGIILALIPATRDFFTGVFSAVGKLLGVIWSFLISEGQIPWIFIVILFLLALPTIVRIIRTFIPKTEELGPSAKDYTTDNFFGVLWRWSYLYSDDLAGFCPNCQTRLVIRREYGYGDGDKTSFYCETCNKNRATLDGDRQFAFGTVWRQIERKINTGKWKEVVEMKKRETK